MSQKSDSQDRPRTSSAVQGTGQPETMLLKKPRCSLDANERRRLGARRDLMPDTGNETDSSAAMGEERLLLRKVRCSAFLIGGHLHKGRNNCSLVAITSASGVDSPEGPVQYSLPWTARKTSRFTPASEPPPPLSPHTLQPEPLPKRQRTRTCCPLWLQHDGLL